MVKNILIVGTGAVATFYSVKLSGSFQVIMLGTWEEGISAINNGVVLEEDRIIIRGNVSAINNWEQVKKADLTIWLTKSYKNKDALIRYKKTGLKNPILILQNGIGQLPDFKKVLGNNISIIEGVSNQAVKLKKPGYVLNTGNGDLLIPKNQLLQDVFSKSNLSFKVVHDIEKEKLMKLSINAVLNPITALFKVKNGVAVKDELKEKTLELIRVIFPFFKKRKIYKTEADYFNSIKIIAEKTAENDNSMLMDLETNRSTEIEQILIPIQKEVKSDVLETIIKQLK